MITNWRRRRYNDAIRRVARVVMSEPENHQFFGARLRNDTRLSAMRLHQALEALTYTERWLDVRIGAMPVRSGSWELNVYTVTPRGREKFAAFLDAHSDGDHGINSGDKPLRQVLRWARRCIHPGNPTAK